MLKLGRNSRLRESRSVRRDLLVALTGAATGCGLTGGTGVTLLLGGLDISLALKVGIPLVIKQGRHGIALDRLALKQHLGHQVQLVATGGKDLLRSLMGLAHDALDLDVDAAGRLLGVVLVVGVVTTQEHLMLGLAKDHGAKLRAHAQAGNHFAGHLGGALKIVARAGGDVVAHQLLGHATAQEDRELVKHLVLGLQEVVLARKLQRVAKRLTAADD